MARVLEYNIQHGHANKRQLTVPVIKLTRNMGLKMGDRNPRDG